MKRRSFITTLGTAAFVAPLLSPVSSFATEVQQSDGLKFPDLGYDFNALEPYIDAQTMELHYTKHHQGYYNNFIAAVKDTKLADTPLERIFESVSKESATVRNNGGGFFNHNLFWENMTPDQQDVPADLKNAIEKDFGSMDSFKEEFSSASKTRFGSGWGWLALDGNGKLFVTSTPNQDNPLMDMADERGIPLLGLDVWEHAYYLKYQNKRAEYVDNFWNIVNWNIVNDRLKRAKAVK